MKTCRAFSLIAGSRTAWVPCVREAEVREKYCRRHGEAVAGVLLGEVVYGEELEEKMLLSGAAGALVAIKKRRRKNAAGI
jgi:hypothetical protein